MNVTFKDDRLCVTTDTEEECFVREAKFGCDGKTLCELTTLSHEFFCENGIKSEYTDCKMNEDHGMQIGGVLKYSCTSLDNDKAPKRTDTFKCVTHVPSSDKIKYDEKTEYIRKLFD